MANELKITDVVDKGVFDQLAKLKSEFNENYVAYKQFVELLANGMKNNPKSFQELSDKIANYTRNANGLIEVQNKLASIQEKQNKLLEAYGNKINRLLTLNTLPKQFDSLAKSINNLSVSLDGFSSKLQGVSSTQNSASQANQTYAQSTNQLNQAISTTEAKYAEIIDNILAYDSHVTRLTADTIQNKSRIKELGDELKSLDKEYRKGTVSITEYLNKSALLKQRQTELAEQNKQYSNLVRNHAAVIISTAGSYNEMNAAVLALEKRLKDMPKDSFLGIEGQKTLQQIQTLKNELKSMDAQMGNYQRNVGNYTSHWNGLNMSVQQVARELPSLAIGWNTFFLAISNNLPILADELKKARMEFKAMQEAGQEGIPVWKQLTKSIFNWQTALVVGITLLSVYGKDIMDWVASLFKSEEAIKNLVDANTELALAKREGISNSVKERAELDLLYKATQDTSRSMQERNAAVDELQKKYPSYFGNMSNEVILAGKAKGTYEELRKELVAMAVARAQLDRMSEVAAKRDDVLMKRRVQYNTYLKALLAEEKAEADLEKARQKAREKGIEEGSLREQVFLSKRNDELEKAQKDAQKQHEIWLDLVKDVKGYDDALNAMSKNIDITSLTLEPGKEDSQEKTAKDLAKYQEDIVKRLSDTRISLIDDEYEKERALAQKKYEENIASIKGNSEAEKELKSNYEKILHDELLSIDKKYLDKIDEEEKKRREEAVKEELEAKQQVYAATAIAASRNLQKTLNDEAEKYAQGLISKEQYEKRKAEITQEYAIQEARNTIALLEAQLSTSGLSDEEAFKIKEALAKAEIELINKVRDARVKAADESNEAERESWSELQNYLSDLENISNNALDGLGTLFRGLTDLITKVVKDGKLGLEDLLGTISAVSEGLTAMMISQYDQQIEKIEEQQEANEEAGEKELDRIEELEEKGAISTEEAEARKRAAEERTAQRDKELEKQKAEIQQKQARWDKANSIIQATIATALAVTKALPNLVLAAVVGAMGAAQIAMISAQPIPKYARGTKNHPGGLAIVGDGGKPELIETDKGFFVTPSVPTLVDIPKRAKVIPDFIDYRKMALHSDVLMLDRQRRNSNSDEPVVVNVNNDYRKLERNTEVTNEGIAKLNRTFRRIAKSSSYRPISSRI